VPEEAMPSSYGTWCREEVKEGGAEKKRIQKEWRTMEEVYSGGSSVGAGLWWQ